ncbi:MAG: hypothetical protein LBJ96_04670, partial [Holosporaceae bacterium]|nr:hypothetical protein [Holosporaceae bacterium]
MKKNSYIAGLKVLLGAAVILSAEQSKSMQPSLGGVSAIDADVIASSQLQLRRLISSPPEEGDYYWLSGEREAEILLNHGADVNTCDENGVSLLRLAIESRCLERVAFLLRHG